MAGPPGAPSSRVNGPSTDALSCRVPSLTISPALTDHAPLAGEPTTWESTIVPDPSSDRSNPVTVSWVVVPGWVNTNRDSTTVSADGTRISRVSAGVGLTVKIRSQPVNPRSRITATTRRGERTTNQSTTCGLPPSARRPAR